MGVARKKRGEVPAQRKGKEDDWDIARISSLTVSVAEAKRSFSDLCSRAGYARETIVVTRRGKPIAAIVGIEELRRSAEMEDQRAVELLERAIATSPGTEKVNLRAGRGRVGRARRLEAGPDGA